MNATKQRRNDSQATRDFWTKIAAEDRLADLAGEMRVHGDKQRIELGDLVRERKSGRIGHVVDVNRETLFARFVDGEKAAYLYRRDVDSVAFLLAQGECIADDETERAFDRYAAETFATWTAEERAFLSGPDLHFLRDGHPECDDPDAFSDHAVHCACRECDPLYEMTREG